MNPLLVVRDLCVRFTTSAGQVAVVDHLSFVVPAGKTLCLVGESGCGKSVTALSILWLLDPAIAQISGSIWFDGQELLQLAERELRAVRGGRIGMVFQDPSASLNPVMTVGAQVAEAVRLHRRLSRRAAREEVVRLLSETRIPDPARRANEYPHELSGGMKQRVMLAMALAGEPKLLIADEPTTALDVTVQAEILALLRRIQEERQLAILLITHDLGVVAQMADQVAVLYAGRLAEMAPADRLLAAPLHPYTAGLLASLPRLDRPDHPTPIPGTVPSPKDYPTGCRFRPRCPKAFDRCTADPPLFEPTAEGRVACWLHADSAHGGTVAG